MAERDGFAVLLDELAAMPAHSRRAILRALSPEERGLLEARTETGPEQGDFPRSDLSAFSPWLAVRIEEVRTDRGRDLTTSRMTAAARHALLRGLEGGGSTAEPVKAMPGKSLLDSFRGMVAAPMGRP